MSVNTGKNTIDRTPRSEESRENTFRPVVWDEGAILDAEQTVDGKRRKWIRFANQGSADRSNWSRKAAQGFVTVNPASDPKLAMLHKGGEVEVGGLILCEISEELAQAREYHYSAERERQLQSVDEKVLAAEQKGMPILNPERSTTVEVVELPNR